MDRHLWYYKFLADVDWLNDFIADVERTDRALVLSLTGQTGVASGFDVTEKGGGQNFSVDISAGQGYDPSGRRFYSASTQNLPFVEDELGDPIEVVGVGNARIVSIYAHYALVDKPGSEVIDGFGDQVFTIQEELVSFHLFQGAEDTLGNELPAAYPGNDMVLLANVQIRQGDLTIANADIDNSVKEYLSLVVGPNNIGDDEIDWGTGPNQVSAVDVPIADAGNFFTVDNVEAALQEVAEKAMAVAVPIGSIIPHYDFNGLVAIDTTYFEYCRGQVVADALSPLDGETLPDGSGRYLVGFGTDGGANLHNAAWAATAVGQAGHTINLQHSHTVSSHNHTGPSHSHGPGTLQFRTASVSGSTLSMYDINGNPDAILTRSIIDAAQGPDITDPLTSNSPSGDMYTDDTGATGTTASGGTGNTGNASPGTDNQLSTVQTIQPRSIRVRYIIRKR